MGWRSRMRRLRRDLIGDVRPVILMYHRVAELDLDPWALAVTPEHFAEQMAYLRRHRTPMPMSDFVESHRRGTLPRDAVAVTFDDGYVDNLTHAKPVLAAEGIPATLFVITGEMQQGQPFWSDELTLLVLGHRGAMNEVMDIAGNPVPLRWAANDAPEAETAGWLGWNPPETPRQAAHVELWRQLRLLSTADRDERMAWLRARLGPVEANGARPMTETQLRSFCAGGLTELGGHTITHPTLPALSRERRREEIEGCREQLARLLGTPPAGFAYPYGDMDGAVLEDVASSGFAWACSTVDTPVKRTSDVFALPRLMLYDWSRRQFARRLRTVP